MARYNSVTAFTTASGTTSFGSPSAGGSDGFGLEEELITPEEHDQHLRKVENNVKKAELGSSVLNEDSLNT